MEKEYRYGINSNKLRKMTNEEVQQFITKEGHRKCGKLVRLIEQHGEKWRKYLLEEDDD